MLSSLLSPNDLSLLWFIDLNKTVEDNCTDGDIRLRDGGNALEGRVEICYNRAWGTICHRGFGDSEAEIICNELDTLFGYAHNLSIPQSPGTFPPGRGPIFIDNIACEDTDQSFGECSVIGIPGFHECYHLQDAGVTCEGTIHYVQFKIVNSLRDSIFMLFDIFLDVNECLIDSLNTCNATTTHCINSAGSYECICRDGYSGDGTNCTGILNIM